MAKGTRGDCQSARRRVLRGIGGMVALLVQSAITRSALAASAAGQVAFLRGAASARQPDEPQRLLREGDPVRPGDLIVTAEDTTLRIEFADGTRAFLGSRTEMRVRSYAAAGDDPVFAVEVAKGVFRFVTGLIARVKPGAFRVDTPAVSVGIRGTDFAGEISGTAVTVVLLDPETQGRPTAIVVSNRGGSVVIDEAGFGTDAPDADTAPSPPRRMRLQSVDNLLRSLQMMQRVPVPRPPR
jgi:hypothetical protein